MATVASTTPASATLLDLQRYRGGSENRVLAGRDVGEDVRRRANVAALDHAAGVVEVRVPKDLFAVTSSFFLGLFGDSIRALGEDGFREHYQFTGKSIERVVNDGVQSVLLTSPLR